jgi:hypothetical protein
MRTAMHRSSMQHAMHHEMHHAPFDDREDTDR